MKPELSEDAEFILTLAERYHVDVRGLIARHVRGPDEVDDLAQNVFVTALEKISQLTEPEGARAWLLEIARNHVRNYWRVSSVRRRREVSLETVRELRLRRIEQRPRIETKEVLSALSECLRRLGPGVGRMLRSVVYEGLSAVEIARRSRKSAEAVRMALMRARRSVRECVAGKVGALW